MRLGCLFLVGSALYAETLTVDLARYTVPDGWTREEKPRTSVMHAQVDEKNRRFCQLYVWLSMGSDGTVDGDFAKEWDGLIVRNYGATAPQVREGHRVEGWQVKAASGVANTQRGKVSVYLQTYSNGAKRMTFSATTNEPGYYQPVIDKFLSSISLTNVPAAPVISSGKTTNFDDGWVATEQADWVRAGKDGLVVLIHYRLPDLRPFNNLDEATAFAWNQMVVPRYRSLSNVWIRRSFWSDGDAFHGKYFAQADARDRDGKPVFVAFFKDGTYGKWIEVIAPDKATFQSRVTAVQQLDGTNWTPLVNLGGLNKFAVAAGDLVGNWESASGAAVQYYEVYTGNNAGMAYASSTMSFAFRPDGTYNSVYKGAQNLQDGRGTRFHGETFTGRFSVNNWEMTLTNRFKGATHKFAVQFEAVKGGRILHVYRGNIEDFHLFKRQ